MGKQTVSVDSGDSGSDNENADVEYEEVSEEEEPSEEEPIEEDPGDELQEVNSCEEPNKDSCRRNEENLCGQQLDDVASCEVDPNKEDSFEEEPNEDDSLEEEPNEDDSCGTPSEDAYTGEQSDESCEEDPYEDDEQCEEETIDEDSCEEVPDVEEPCEEPEEPVEEEPIEDPEEETCEESPVNSSYNRNNENSTQSNFGNMNMPSGTKKISELPGIRNSSYNVIVQEKQATTGITEKKRHSKWDTKEEASKVAEDGDGMARKKRKSRWSRWSDDNSQSGMGTTLKSPGIEINLEIPKLNAQLFEIGKKLRSGVVDERPLSERSPSPPPIYNNLGLKINTREARLRSKLMKQRQTIISELIRKSPNFKPPPDYTSCKLQKKLYIPSKEYPGYNFVGLILGPCGNTHKRMEKETGAKILLRGKDSVVGGKPMQHKPDHPSDKEDLHVLIEADDGYSLDAAVAMVEKLLIPVEDGNNIHKLSQLRELAELKGTLRGTNTSNSRTPDPCDICGDSSHTTSVCPLTASASGVNSIGHQVNFFDEMGGGLSSFSVPPLPVPTMLPAANSVAQVSTSNKEIDDANLFVGYLPQSMDDDKLVELFCPFGPLCEAKVIRDWNTGLSKGYGFVKYTDGINAAKAVAQMNGYSIDGKMLAVRIAGVPPVQSNRGFGGLVGQLPIYPGPAAIAQRNPDPGVTRIQVNRGSEGLVGQLPIYPGPAAIAQRNPDPGVTRIQVNRGSEGLAGQLPIYPGPAAIAQSNPDPMHWPGPPESRIPETVSSFSNSGSFSNSSRLPIHNTPFSGLHSVSHGPSYQTPLSTSLFSGDLAVSSKLAQFPGYPRSRDPPAESYYHQSTPSTSLSSSQARFTQNFGSYQMPPF